MTTEQRMPTTTHPGRVPAFGGWPAIALLALLLTVLLTGCQKETLHTPSNLVSPYTTMGPDFVWAVAPLRNESGVSVVDNLAISDSLTYQIQQVHGLTAIPVNRVLTAMRAMEMQSVDSPEDAIVLADAVGADAIIAGSITAWDPYDPPEIGMNLVLYVLNDDLRDPNGEPSIDPRLLQQAVTEGRLPARARRTSPLSIASDHFDAANHEVLASVRQYAEGRHDPSAPMGWRLYVASMSLFTEFACHQLTEQLLDAERLRMARLALADD
jgi:hypothetical protein